METSPSTYSTYQWTGFYITGTSVMKELKEINKSYILENLVAR